jgi:hypothetical protein
MHKKWVISDINGFDIKMAVESNAIVCFYDLPANQYSQSRALFIYTAKSDFFCKAVNISSCWV